MHHPVDVLIEGVVPEPQDGEAFPAEDGVSLVIMPGLAILSVSPAIELHDELELESDEIQKITSKGSLSAEMVSIRS